MSGKVCSIDGCDRKFYARTYCTKHYGAWLKHGDPLGRTNAWGLTLDERIQFYSRPQANGCIEWGGTIRGDGYAQTSVDGKVRIVSRLVYERAHGPIPAGMVVRHKCDNPPCINIEHLEVGTPAQNSADMVERERQVRGEAVNTAKLTEAQVLEIDEASRRGERSVDLAREYGVSVQTVYKIRTRRNWRHVFEGAA